MSFLIFDFIMPHLYKLNLNNFKQIKQKNFCRLFLFCLQINYILKGRDNKFIKLITQKKEQNV